MKCVIILLLLFSCSCEFSYSQSRIQKDMIFLNSEDKRILKIDNFVNICLGTEYGETTLGMRGCIIEGRTKMDSLLNITYKEVLKTLNKDDQERLRISQRNWLQFYNSETSFTNEVYRSWSNYSKYRYGSQVNVTEALMTYTLLRERVNRLCYYLTAE